LKNGSLEVALAKELGNPYELFETRRSRESDFSDVLAGNHRLLMGHCRASTKGETIRKNAHPFMFENIIGTHNGTLSNRTHSEFEGYKKLGTDSECIFAEIENSGIEETVKKFRGPWSTNTEQCEDAYALVWFNASENSLNMLRNRERPLYYAFDKDKKTLFYSSEACHLAAAMVDTPHDDKYIYSLPENMHYSWVIPEWNQSFGKAKAVKREGRPPVPFQGTTYHTKNTKTSGTYGNDAEDTAHPYLDSYTMFWQKWSKTRNRFLYAKSEYGTFYDTLQEAWDALTYIEKLGRLNKQQVPKSIKSGMVYDEEKGIWKEVQEEPDTNAKNTPGNNVVSFASKLREDRFSEIAKTYKEKGIYSIHHSQNQRVLWDKDLKKYHIFEYSPTAAKWIESESKVCPDFVPFTELDVNARHDFIHKGKKKRKVISRKGFKGSMLVKQAFDKLMGCGCINCTRIPTWTNPVVFINNEDFFCEHCSRDTDLVQTFLKSSTN